MAIDFVALHEPLVEWVHEQTAAASAEYVTITAFGEQHGLDEQQSFRLLQTCKDWGLLSDRQLPLCGQSSAQATGHLSGGVQAPAGRGLERQCRS
ncbi:MULTISPECIES: hypothetical protein [Streptomyces]